MGLRQSDAAAFGHAVWESRSSPLSPSDAESGHAGTLRSAKQQLWWTRRIRKSAGHAEPELQSAGPEPKLRRRRWPVVTSLGRAVVDCKKSIQGDASVSFSLPCA